MKKINRWLFAKSNRREKSSSLMPSPLLRRTSKDLILYQDLRIPLDLFLNALYDMDFSGIVINGNPTDREVKEAWNKIYLAYSNEVAGGADNPIVDKIKEIEALNAKVIFIDTAASHLSMSYDEEIITILNSPDFGLRCDLKSGESPFEKLNGMLVRAKRFIVEMEVAQNELKKMQEEQTGETNRDSFDDSLISISNYQGYGVKASDISVSQYLRMIKRMNASYRKQLQHAH